MSDTDVPIKRKPFTIEDSIAQSIDEERVALSHSASVAGMLNPGKLADAARLGKQFGVDPSVYMDPTPEPPDSSPLSDHELLALNAKSHGMGRWLSDPKNLALVKDDLPALHRIADALNAGKDQTGYLTDLADAHTSGLLRLVGMERLTAAAGGRGDRDKALAQYAELQHRLMQTPRRAYQTEDEQAAAQAREAETNLFRFAKGKTPIEYLAATLLAATVKVNQIVTNPRAYIRSSVEQLPYSYPALAGGMIGTPLGPEGVAAGVTLGSFATEYGAWIDEALQNRLRAEGKSPDDLAAITAAFNDTEWMQTTVEQAARKAAGTSLAEGVSALLPAEAVGFGRRVGESVKGQIKRVGKETLRATAVEAGMEAGGELLGRGLAKGGLSPEDIPEGIEEAAYAPGSGGIAKVAEVSIARAFGTSKAGLAATAAKVAQATQDGKTATQVAETAHASEALRRLPQATQGLIRRLLEGSGIQDVQVPKAAFDAAYQGEETTPARAAVDITKDGAKRYAAAGSSQFVSLPAEDVIEKVYGTPAWDRLFPDMRWHPDGLTANEAQAKGEQLQQAAQKAVEQNRQMAELFQEREELAAEADRLESGEEAAAAPAEAAMPTTPPGGTAENAPAAPAVNPAELERGPDGLLTDAALQAISDREAAEQEAADEQANVAARVARRLQASEQRAPMAPIIGTATPEQQAANRALREQGEATAAAQANVPRETSAAPAAQPEGEGAGPAVAPQAAVAGAPSAAGAGRLQTVRARLAEIDAKLAGLQAPPADAQRAEAAARQTERVVRELIAAGRKPKEARLHAALLVPVWEQFARAMGWDIDRIASLFPVEFRKAARPARMERAHTPAHETAPPAEAMAAPGKPGLVAMPTAPVAPEAAAPAFKPHPTLLALEKAQTELSVHRMQSSRLPGASEATRRQMTERDLRLAAAVEDARMAFDAAVAAGEAQPRPEPTLEEVAAGDPALESTQAARRVLAKRAERQPGPQEAVTPAQSAAPAAPRAPLPAIPLTEGRETTIHTVGATYPARYALVELSDLIPSHTTRHAGGQQEFTPDPRYPEGLQPRRYESRPTEAAKVERFAVELPDKIALFLGTGATTTDGPPVVTQSGVVINGNGRAMAMGLAKPAALDAYKAALRAEAGQYGLTEAQVDGLKRPILVRQVDLSETSPEAAVFAREGNEALTQAQSSADRMAALRDVLPPETLLLDVPEDTTLPEVLAGGSAKARALLDRIYDGLPENLRPAFFTEPGQLSDAGKEAIGKLLLGSVVEPDLASQQRPAVAAMLTKAIPQLAAMQAELVPDLNLRPALEGALRYGTEFLDNWKQPLGQGFLGGADPLSTLPDEQQQLVRFISKNANKDTALRKLIGAYVVYARGSTMMGQAAVTPAEALQAAAKGLQKKAEPGPTELFQTAFHGSPRRDIERFSTEFIGTGEGAQVYGFGLYFAGKKEVAQAYRDKLGPGRGVEPRDIAARVLQATNGDAEAAIAEIENRKRLAKVDRAAFAQNMDKVIAAIRDGSARGGLYTVDLAPAEDEYLLWDKPLSEQSEKVQKAVAGIAAETLKKYHPVKLQTDIGGPIWAVAPKQLPQGVSVSAYVLLNIGQRGIATFKTEEQAQAAIESGSVLMAPDMTGEQVYRRMADPEAASKMLAAAGIPGIKYLDQGSRGAMEWFVEYEDGRTPTAFATKEQAQQKLAEWKDRGAVRVKHEPQTFNYVIFDDKLIKIVELEQAQQPSGEGEPLQPRGGLQHNEAERGNVARGLARRFTINFYRDSNFSTFNHELTHYIAEVFGDLAELPEAPQEFKDDYAAMLKFMGAKDRASITTEQQEKFARAGELYLLEGKAPSSAMRRVFRLIAAAMEAVYKSVKALGVELNPEIRAVFDRRLASRDEIAAAQQEGGGGPMLTEADFDTPEEFAAYKAKFDEGVEGATERLNTQLLADQTAARRRLRREREQQLTEQVTRGLQRRPEMVAASMLTAGKLPDGSAHPTIEPFKISRASAAEEFSAAVKKHLDAAGALADEGVSVQAAAETFGATSGDELAAWVLGAAEPEKLVKRIVAEHMRAEYPELLPASLRHANARQALQGPELSEALYEEYRALLMADARKRGAAERRAAKAENALAETKAAAKEGKRKRRQALATLPPLQDIRATAYAMVSREPVGRLVPWTYLRSAGANSTEAAKLYAADKPGEAAAAKYAEILNREAYREALKLQERNQVGRRFLARQSRTKNQQALNKAADDFSFGDQMAALLERFNLAIIAPIAQKRRLSLAKWIERLAGEGFLIRAPDWLLKEDTRQPWQTLNSEQFQELVETARQIAHVASWRNRLIQSEREVTLQEAGEEMAQAVADSKRGKPLERRPDEPTTTEALGQAAADRLDEGTRMQTFITLFDGGRDDGPWHRAYARGLFRGADVEVERMPQAYSEYLGLYKKHYTKKQRRALRQRITVAGQAMTHDEVLAALSLAGSVTGRARILTRFGAEGMAELMSLASDKDVEFLNDRFAWFDKWFPEIREQARKFRGIEVKQVEPAAYEIETTDGHTRTVRGGYYPIDYTDVRSKGLDDEQAFLATKQGKAAGRMTQHGYEETRAEDVGAKGDSINLARSVVLHHIYNVVHDLSMRAPLVDAARLLDQPRVRDAVVAYYGKQAYLTLKEQLKRIGAGSAQGRGPNAKLFASLRYMAVSAQLGFRTVTALKQYQGLRISAADIGAKWVLGAIPKATTPGTWRFILDSSRMMRNQLKGGWFREVQELRSRVPESKRTAVMETAFSLLTWAQWHVNAITWTAQYSKSSAELAGTTTDLKAIHKEAVQRADQAVRRTQGTGHPVDLSLLETGSPFERLLTTYFTDASLKIQQGRLQHAAIARGEPMARAQFLGKMLAIVLIPALLTEIGYALFGGDDDDDESWLVRVAKNTGSEILDVSPLGRQAIGPLKGWDYHGPPGLGIIQATADAVRQAGGKDPVDAAAWRAYGNLAGLATGLPARAAIELGQAFYELAQGHAPSSMVGYRMRTPPKRKPVVR